MPRKKKLNIVSSKESADAFTFIDLFCGIGGFHQALAQLNGKCVFACDIDKDCRETYYNNYGLMPKEDITKLDISKIPNFDILCGGFPCQAFSNAGKKKSFDDKRGKLFNYIIDIAKAKKPKFMFLENVKHIRKVDDGKVFQYILDEMDKNGYVLKEDETIFGLSPHQLGVPQQRERVIFVCIRKDLYDPLKKIQLNISKNIEINFDKIIDTNEEETQKYKIKEIELEVLNIWDEMIQQMEVGQKLSPTILCHEFYRTYSLEEFTQLPQWKQDYIEKNKPIYEKYKDKWDIWYEKHKDKLQLREIYGKMEWQAGPKLPNDSILNHFIQLRQSGIRVKKKKFFPTLVAIGQIPIYGKEKRHITPRECARLQSFPDTFKLHENGKVSYKQFGNAVNVDVIKKVAEATLTVYDNVM
jgi:DNA (cytosine-5)-methyltransferase 1